MKVDFHMHSTYSDGMLSPKELIEIIKEKEIKVCALTDHDCILGINEYIEEANKYNIRVIPGLELTTESNGEPIHVLAYFKSLDSIPESFKEYLLGMQKARFERMKKMVDNVNHIFGFNVDFNEIVKKHKYMIERPHLADEISNITKESKGDIFKKYIGNDSPAYVASTHLPFSEGVKMIREAGGLAVIAHPYNYKKNNPWDLINQGVDGIEVFYYPASITKYKKYRKYALKNDLVLTGGSDFHRAFEDYKHVPIGSKEIEEKYVLNFLDKIDKLK